MRLFNNKSIRQTLTMLMALTTGVALLISCVAFIAVDYFAIRDSRVTQLSALADILASNSTAALSFDQKEAAEDLLASLKNRSTIEYACIYDGQGKLFAEYGAFEPGCIPNVHDTSIGHHFSSNGHLHILRPIIEDGDYLGTLYLHTTTVDLMNQTRKNANIAVIVLLVSLVVAILVASRLQGVVSKPIVSLTTTAQRISNEGDYSIRVKRQSNDEIGALYEQFNHMLDRIQDGETQLREARDELEVRVTERTRQLSAANAELYEQMAEREEAANKLARMHQQLLDTARQAGMAEVATSVLHNVGNILNSVNVTATLIGENVRKSEIHDLGRALEIMEEHEGDLTRFMSDDSQGKHLAAYLLAAGRKLKSEQAEMLESIDSLAQNIEHIKAIISMQQSYTRVSGLTQRISLPELLDDAIALNNSSFSKYGIEVIREYAELPEVVVDKHKLLQTVVNLVKNAKESLVDGGRPDMTLIVRTTLSEDDRFRIEVIDNGVGISKEHMERIFSHGFTTKKYGHGFGLHSCGNAAGEMNGTLTVRSDGPGQGAAFTLQLPLSPAAETVPQ